MKIRSAVPENGFMCGIFVAKGKSKKSKKHL